MINTRSIQIKHSRLLSVLGILALMLILSACSGTPPTTGGLAAAWVGKIEGTDAFIGLASNGNELMAYICDGKTITQWFTGQVGKDKLDLVAGSVDLTAGTARLVAQLTKDSASGSVTIAGAQYKFQATRASGDTGLYRSEETIGNEKWVGGWVVLAPGQLRGARVSSLGTVQTQTSLSTSAKLIDPDTKPY